MMGCKKCSGICGWLLLIAGLLFLLKDIGLANWWNISGWSIVFLLAGIAHIGMGHCRDCQEMCGMKSGKKK